MASRNLPLVLSACGALSLAACSSETDAIGSNAPIIGIAVGAQVTLVFSNFCNDPQIDPLVQGCLPEPPDALASAVLSGDGPFELVDSSFEGGKILVTVRAKRPGDTTLSIDYTDFSDEAASAAFVLVAAEITGVDADVTCRDGPLEVESYAVTTGSEIPFRLTAKAEDLPLATGDLPLIEDASSFSIVEMPGLTPRAVAPATPGQYTWDLAGNSTLQFTVYEPSDLEITLEGDGGRAHIGRAALGLPVCIHDGSMRAYLEVTSGDCLPLIAGFEIEGAVPVDMAQGAFDLELSGSGTCEVKASLEGGGTSSITLSVDNVLQPPSPGSGEPITTEPVAYGGQPAQRDSCPLIVNISNGQCEIIDAAGYVLPDGDCFLDWEWVLELYSVEGDNETPLVPGVQQIGQGLWVELHVGVLYQFAELDLAVYSTNDLAYTSDPAMGIDIDSKGCIEDDRQVLAIRPTSSGNYAIHLNANNVYEPTVLNVSSAPVAKVVFGTEAPESQPISGGEETHWFVGSSTDVNVLYQASGGKLLFGVAPLLVSSDTGDTGATISGHRIHVGATPGTIALSSDVGPGQHLLHALDGTGIAEIGAFGYLELSPGEDGCLAPLPRAAGGIPIYGSSPVRPRIALSGAAAVVDVRSYSSYELCFIGYEVGSSTVDLAWGNASAQTVITVN